MLTSEVQEEYFSFFDRNNHVIHNDSFIGIFDQYSFLEPSNCEDFFTTNFGSNQVQNQSPIHIRLILGKRPKLDGLKLL